MRATLRALLAGTVSAAVLSAAGPAAAAPPAVADGVYVGECCGGAYYSGHVMVAGLRVAADGRNLRAGSYIGCYEDGDLEKLRAGRRRRIHPNGTFAWRARGPGVRFRVRGRFRGPNLARLVYTVRPRRNFNCPPGPRPLRLHRRQGEPPFVGCASQPGRTVVSSPEARVFAQRRVFSWAFLPFAYGCLYSGGPRVSFGLDGLTEAFLGQVLNHFRLAGPYAAFGCGGNLSGGCWSAVYVVDLRDGSRRVVNLDTGGFSGGASPTDVEIKENGSVAWIEPLYSPDGTGSYRVGAVDASGRRVLDQGSRIDPDSLTLSDSTLTWVHARRPRSAALD
jgi:hypothetical protein